MLTSRSILGYLIVINLFFCLTAYTQQLSDEISSKMSESDKKKLNKTDELKTKGELVLSDVGYMGDSELLTKLNDESKEFKKILSKRVEAGGYFKESNSTRYELYSKYIDNFWKKFTGNKSALDNIKKRETMAIDSFKYAQNIRKESDKKSKSPERVPLLIKAENVEAKALSNLEKVLVSYFYYPTVYNSEWFSDKPVVVEPKEDKTMVQNKTEEKTIADSEPQPKSPPKTADENKAFTNNDTSLYTAMDINEDQIDMFNKFLQKAYPSDYEKYIIDFQKLDYSDIEQLKTKWYGYKFPSTDTANAIVASSQQTDTLQVAAIQNITDSKAGISDHEKQAGTNSDNLKTDTSKTQKQVGSDITLNKESITKETSAEKWKKQRTKEIQNVSGTTEKKTTSENEKTSSDETIATGFLYRVQIAACRVTLEPQILNSLYTGNEKVIETFEDNWNKYAIGQYNTYRDARKVRDQVNIPGAFVVAYLNGKRIRITPSNLYGTQSMDYIIPANINPKLIEYKIQIAASKFALPKNTLQKIYSGSYPIETKEENGWYKYLIHAGNTLKSARDMINQINIPEAFMVTYYQNERINLITAIRLTKNN